MRVDRQKKVSRDLRKYKLVFGIHEPYRILMDPAFIHVCLEAKVQIKEQLSKILGSRIVWLQTLNCMKGLARCPENGFEASGSISLLMFSSSLNNSSATELVGDDVNQVHNLHP